MNMVPNEDATVIGCCGAMTKLSPLRKPLRRWILITPRPIGTWAMTYAQQKDFPLAIRELQKAKSLLPGNALVLGDLAYTL
jgi:hypothetical protein